MSAIVERLKSQSTSRPRTGRVVIVYDGRIWPVVKCGAVYVTDDDKTKTVTKNIIAHSTASEDKKKKTSKYTLAVGSSFGHVHAFLKDSDHVLKSLDKNTAEDKCLMLIRKPKSASKQMLKAHSWANLSSPDMHLHQPDGSLKTDPYKQFKNRGKRKTGELTLPPNEVSGWQHSLANQNIPFKGPTNQSSAFKELPSVNEYGEDSKSDVLPRQHNKTSSNVPNLSNSYPYDRSAGLNNNERVKARSTTDLTQNNCEINNNKMGNILGKHEGKKGQSHKTEGQGSRPRGPPPAAPGRHVSGPDRHNNNSLSNNEMTSSRSLAQQQTDDRNNNRPDIISNVNINNNRSDSDRSSNGYYSNQRVKHDSGFHSEARLSNDEMYDVGFRQELTVKSSNGKNITSSPRGSTSAVNENVSKNRVDNRSCDQILKSRPEPQYYPNVHCSSNKTSKHPPKSGNDKMNVVADNARAAAKNVNTRNGVQYKNENNQRNDSNNHNSHMASDPDYAIPNKRNSQTQQNGSAGYKNGLVPGSSVRPSPKDKVSQSHELEHSKSAPKRTSSYSKRKSMGDIKEENRVTAIDNEEPVFRAQSMGDLNNGCTFSLVGQKKADSFQSIADTEFTGSQLTKHFRKYRGMKQESKHGSLPFRGKTVDTNEDSMHSLANFHSQYQLSTVSDNATPNVSKPMHYGSLQHLPASSYENSGSETKPALSARHREKTPLKPRRCLPQVPGDVDEKKKHMSDLVKIRVSGSSASRSSTSPGSSRNSNRAGSSTLRQGGISATPSDREVSALLNNNNRELSWAQRADKHLCNKANTTNANNHRNVLPPDAYYDSSIHAIHTSESFGSHDQNFVPPSGGRLSESGQTTLTSQSTIDSGYITNDQEPDMLSTSSYAKTLKQSAQNMYSTSKLFKPSKGEQQPQFQTQNTKGNNHHSSKGNNSHYKNAKDSHTRNWLDQHPGSYTGSHHNVNGQEVNPQSMIDTNNNKQTPIQQHNVTELNHSENLNNRHGDQTENLSPKKQPLMHHSSEPNARDIERLNFEGLQYITKGKSISMSQGLNLIEKSSKTHTGNFLSKSQPKFTGSLKDLIGSDKQIVPVETLKIESFHSSGTLPGSWKFEGGNKTETSLKLLGKPSLFQLLQSYNLYTVRMKIPDNFKIVDNIRMIECEVVLPSPWILGKDSAGVTSLKGSYAKLGGPNSAFKPVVAGGNNIKAVSMVTILELTSEMTDTFEHGHIDKGDLIIEVNEKLMMGEDLATLSTMLQSCQGELLLTVARDKARELQQKNDKNSSSPTEDDYRKMEQKINDLLKELRRKDRTLKQLNALLPWKQSAVKGHHTDDKDQDPYLCSLSEDEFIV